MNKDMTMWMLHGLTALVMALAGFMCMQAYKDVEELKMIQAQTSRELHIHYIRKDDFRVFESRIIDQLDRIEQKLDGKVDK